MEKLPTENVTFVNFHTVMEKNQTFASTGSTVKTSFGLIRIHTITLITIGSIAIRIESTTWIFHVAVVLLGGGARRRGDAFWTRQGIIAGQIQRRKIRMV